MHIFLLALLPLAWAFQRPLVHFTPTKGWMNDPNGLFYDEKNSLWHMYYQYNPDHIVWSEPVYWGHATSKDLTQWHDHGAALGSDNVQDGIFSGNIVVDRNNTSGFFNSSVDPELRIVAIYTLNTPEEQTQDIAYSLDGGYSFVKYAHNPVLSHNLTQFRDPKVFWHAPSSQWVMVVAMSQQYKVQIYGSADLKHWVLHSNFTLGVLGFQYECPGLVEVPVENSTDTRWVLFVAINPGLPLGGSANQYFVGDFDGFTFTPDDSQARFMDYGKDFYAYQVFDNVPKEHGVVGVAWASNWQYCAVVPATTWRSSMSLARNMTLARRHVNPETEMLTLIQRPVLGSLVRRSNRHTGNVTVHTPLTFNSSATGVFEFDLTFKVKAQNCSTAQLQVLAGARVNGTLQLVRAGYDNAVTLFFADRAMDTEINKNPFFTDKTAAYVDPYAYDGEAPVFKMYGVVDGNVMEVHLNDGLGSMTNTFFLDGDAKPDFLELSSTCPGMYSVEYSVAELTLDST